MFHSGRVDRSTGFDSSKWSPRTLDRQGGLGDVGKFAAMHAAAKGAAGAQLQYRLVAISEAQIIFFQIHDFAGGRMFWWCKIFQRTHSANG